MRYPRMHRVRAWLLWVLGILSVLMSGEGGGLVNGHFTVMYPQPRGDSNETELQFPCISPPFLLVLLMF